jgi:hypothetical protein
VKEPSTSNMNFNKRQQTVRNFIIACLNNQARIKSFETLTSFLNNDRINLIFKLKQSGKHTDGYGRILETFYTNADAEMYFEWLVAVVNETEEATDDLRKKATDQLFRFLYLMRDDIERSKNYQVIEPYDWQRLFMSFDERLTDMQRIIDKGDKDTIAVLKSLLPMVEKNVEMLKKLCEIDERIFGKGDADVRPNKR